MQQMYQRLSRSRWRAALAPHRLALAAITLVSVFFNFWNLGQNGFGNLYYAAAVKSMGSNWHAFFFASLDSAGFVTVDKPPLGFWLQVLSTKIFGFTAFAVFLPQAVAGVLSVVLLYWLVRRHFGRVAGLIAALALAASPISVVTNRNNTIDSTLMLALLLAAWATFRAVETDKLWWLVVAGLLVAVGFNIKMLEAYLVVPALGLTYLVGSRRAWLARVGRLAAAGAAMAALSLAWVVGVDVIPASLRPWVGSTQNNSELSLAFGYNGLQRLTGNSGGGPGGAGGPPSGGAGGFPGGAGGPPSGGAGGPGNFPSGAPLEGGASAPTGGFRAEGFPGAGQAGPGGAGGGSVGMFNTGNPGILRLFTNPLGGQIAWLLPLALFGILALLMDRRFRPREDRQQQSLVLWGTWLLTMVIFFSVAGFFHQYYLSQMAPAIAALVGIGIVTMWAQFGKPGWRGWLLPLALGVTALVQLGLISGDTSWGAWLIPVIAIPSVIVVVALVILRVQPGLLADQRAKAVVVAVGLAALLVTPLVWSAYPALTNLTQDLPLAGASASNGFGVGGGGTASVNTALISYLEANQGSATYLVATGSSQTSAPIILATDRAVMTLGGFSGGDPILTVAQLQALVAKGTVRYFLLDGQGGAASTASSGSASIGDVSLPGAVDSGAAVGPGGQSSLTQWVAQTCTAVSAATYGGTQGTSGFGGGQQLYDCAGK